MQEILGIAFLAIAGVLAAALVAGLGPSVLAGTSRGKCAAARSEGRPPVWGAETTPLGDLYAEVTAMHSAVDSMLAEMHSLRERMEEQGPAAADSIRRLAA